MEGKQRGNRRQKEYRESAFRSENGNPKMKKGEENMRDANEDGCKGKEIEWVERENGIS